MEYEKIINLKLGGKIKDKPEDFIVEELHESRICTINYSLMDGLKKNFVRGEGKFVHFTMIKENLNTFQALNLISKSLKISRKRLGSCGNKDKRAITSQRISVFDASARDISRLKFRNIKIKDVSCEDYRLNPGNLKGNRFTITVKDIPLGKLEISEKLEEFSKKIKRGVPNYFGIQRFGELREVNHLIGEEIVSKNYEKAVRILLTQTGKESEEATKAREKLNENWGNFKDALEDFPRELDIEIKVLNSLVSGKDYRESLFSLPPQIKDIFVHAYQSYLFNKKLSNMVKNGLVSRTVLLSPIKNEDIYYKGYERKTIIIPEDFKVLNVKNGEVKISFSLNKGCYATVVLSELLDA